MTHDMHACSDHSCSDYCGRPDCIKRQRNEWREQIDHALAARDNVQRELDDLRDKYMDELVAAAQLTKKCDELSERLERDTPTIRRLRDLARLQSGEARMPECLVFGEILNGLDTVLGDTHE